MYDVGVEYCVHLGNGTIYVDQIMRSDSAAVGSAPLPFEYCVLCPLPIRVPPPLSIPTCTLMYLANLSPTNANQHRTQSMV